MSGYVLLRWIWIFSRFGPETRTYFVYRESESSDRFSPFWPEIEQTSEELGLIWGVVWNRVLGFELGSVNFREVRLGPKFAKPQSLL